MKPTHLSAILLAALVTNSSARAVTFALVTVGNPGNAPDTRYNDISIGSVDRVFYIGKYEVTAGLYTEFLNAVAKADPNGLYNPAMGVTDGTSNTGSNIKRTGDSPDYSYSVAADWANRPANYVSFWDAARFANWLHNDQPTGPQGPGTTEDGAYINVGNQTTFARQSGARFFLPNADEWYKAAYHKNDGVTGNYWNYPTASDTAPLNTLPDPGNHANTNPGGSNYTIGSPYYRTPVGAFVNSASPYGTFDQGGNIWELNERVVNAALREVRGGGFNLHAGTLAASYRASAVPTSEFANIGFRVASVIPGPGAQAGDFNGDGTVNAADYTVWRNNLWTDFNLFGNGDETGLSEDIVDEFDYELWKLHYGEPYAGAAAGHFTSTVPEPTSFGLAILGLLLMTISRRIPTDHLARN